MSWAANVRLSASTVQITEVISVAAPLTAVAFSACAFGALIPGAGDAIEMSDAAAVAPAEGTVEVLELPVPASVLTELNPMDKDLQVGSSPRRRKPQSSQQRPSRVAFAPVACTEHSVHSTGRSPSAFQKLLLIELHFSDPPPLPPFARPA